MEGITGKILLWMMELGLSEGTSVLMLRIGVIITMLALTFAIDKLCKLTVLPLIKRITAKTDFKWDDYIFNDQVLKDLSSLVSPIII